MIHVVTLTHKQHTTQTHKHTTFPPGNVLSDTLAPIGASRWTDPHTAWAPSCASTTHKQPEECRCEPHIAYLSISFVAQLSPVNRKYHWLRFLSSKRQIESDSFGKLFQCAYLSFEDGILNTVRSCIALSLLLSGPICWSCVQLFPLAHAAQRLSRGAG